MPGNQVNNALEQAIKDRDLTAALEAKEAGADISLNVDGYSIIYLAILANDTQVLRQLIDLNYFQNAARMCEYYHFALISESVSDDTIMCLVKAYRIVPIVYLFAMSRTQLETLSTLAQNNEIELQIDLEASEDSDMKHAFLQGSWDEFETLLQRHRPQILTKLLSEENQKIGRSVALQVLALLAHISSQALVTVSNQSLYKRVLEKLNAQESKQFAERLDMLEPIPRAFSEIAYKKAGVEMIPFQRRSSAASSFLAGSAAQRLMSRVGSVFVRSYAPYDDTQTRSLYVALEIKDFEQAFEFYLRGADITVRLKNDYSILSLAIEKGSNTRLRDLFNKGFTAVTFDDLLNAAENLAISAATLNEVHKHYCAQTPGEPTTITKDQCCLLLVNASKAAHLEYIKQLLTKGIITKLNEADKVKLMSWAMQLSSLEVCQFLFNKLFSNDNKQVPYQQYHDIRNTNSACLMLTQLLISNDYTVRQRYPVNRTQSSLLAMSLLVNKMISEAYIDNYIALAGFAKIRINCVSTTYYYTTFEMETYFHEVLLYRAAYFSGNKKIKENAIDSIILYGCKLINKGLITLEQYVLSLPGKLPIYGYMTRIDMNIIGPIIIGLLSQCETEKMTLTVNIMKYLLACEKSWKPPQEYIHAIIETLVKKQSKQSEKLLTHRQLMLLLLIADNEHRVQLLQSYFADNYTGVFENLFAEIYKADMVIACLYGYIKTQLEQMQAILDKLLSYLVNDKLKGIVVTVVTLLIGDKEELELSTAQIRVILDADIQLSADLMKCIVFSLKADLDLSWLTDKVVEDRLMIKGNKQLLTKLGETLIAAKKAIGVDCLLDAGVDRDTIQKQLNTSLPTFDLNKAIAEHERTSSRYPQLSSLAVPLSRFMSSRTS